MIVKLSAQVTPGTPHALSVPGLFLSPDLSPLLHSQHLPDAAVGCWIQAGFQLLVLFFRVYLDYSAVHQTSGITPN